MHGCNEEQVSNGVSRCLSRKSKSAVVTYQGACSRLLGDEVRNRKDLAGFSGDIYSEACARRVPNRYLAGLLFNSLELLVGKVSIANPLHLRI